MWMADSVVDHTEGLSNDLWAMFQDASGTVWAGTNNGLMQFREGRFVRVDGTAAIPEYRCSDHQDRAGRRGPVDIG